MMLRRVLKWLGIEANARAIMTLLAIGTAIGMLGGFAFNHIAPLLSPTLSLTDFGEGYRRGRREAELEFRLTVAERSLKAMRVRHDVEERVKKMSDDEIDKAIEEFFRAREAE